VPNSNTVVISSHRVFDASGTHQKEDSGCLTVYDASRVPDEFAAGAMERCVIRRIVPVVGGKGAGAIQCVRGANGQDYVVGWCAEPVPLNGGWADSKRKSRMYRANIGTGAIEQSVVLDFPVPWDLRAQRYRNDWSLGPDGNIYTFDDQKLLRVNPLDLTRREVVGTVTRGGRIAWCGERMFLAGDLDLREISGVLAKSHAGP
jgi:hypothetical protein